MEATLWTRLNPEAAVKSMQEDPNLKNYSPEILLQQVKAYNNLYKPTYMYPLAEFWGKATLERQRSSKSVRTLRGLRAEGRGIPRPGMVVRDGDGSVIGEITSGTFSPTLRQGIGLALLDPDVPEGAPVTVDVRKRSEAFTVVKPPFVSPSTSS